MSPSSKSKKKTSDAKASSAGTTMTMTKQLEDAARQGDTKTVQKSAEEYAQKNNLSVYEVMTQGRDTDTRQTILHMVCACQSASQAEGETANSNSSKDKDIVYELTMGEWAKRHNLVVVPDAAKPDNSVLAYLGAQDQHGLTPLMLAAQLTTPELALARVNTLLEAAGDSASNLASDKSSNGATALHFAVGASVGISHKDVVLALAKAAPPNVQINSKVGGTPLHWAAASRHNMVVMFDLLVSDLGADVYAQNDQGLTPLIIAVATQQDENASWLAKHSGGVVKTADSGDGDDQQRPLTTGRGCILQGNNTAYHMAAGTNMPKTLQALVEFDVDKVLDDPDNLTAECCVLGNESHGLTPLDMAVHDKFFECVKLLLPFIESTKNIKVEDDDAIKKYIAEKQPEVKTIMAQHAKVGAGRGGGDKWEGNKTNGNATPDEMAHFELVAKQEALQIKTGPQPSPEQKAEALQFKSEGNAAFSSKDYQTSSEMYSKAIECDATDATFYSNRSASYMQLKLYKKALWDAVTCRHLKPEWTKGCYRLAVARLALERYEDAAVAAWEGLEFDENNDELRSLLKRAVKKGQQAHKKNKSAAAPSNSEKKEGGNDEVKTTATAANPSPPSTKNQESASAKEMNSR
jgi:ankyrin repeat protein